MEGSLTQYRRCWWCFGMDGMEGSLTQHTWRVLYISAEYSSGVGCTIITSRHPFHYHLKILALNKGSRDCRSSSRIKEQSPCGVLGGVLYISAQYNLAVYRFTPDSVNMHYVRTTSLQLWLYELLSLRMAISKVLVRVLYVCLVCCMFCSHFSPLRSWP